MSKSSCWASLPAPVITGRLSVVGSTCGLQINEPLAVVIRATKFGFRVSGFTNTTLFIEH